MRITIVFSFAALSLAVAVPVAGPAGAYADQVQQGPFEGLYGGFDTHHPFTNLPHVAGSVTVELMCRADLGCDAWDWTDCNTTTDACDVGPETKWVTLTIAGTEINIYLSYIGVPDPGDPPVPGDGLFFRPWHYNSMDPAYAYCGISDCSGSQATNTHRLTVTQDQWNTWVTAGGGAITMLVTSSSATMNLPPYCTQHASGENCCDPQTDPPGECSHRPGSNATIRITYWPSGRCCHSDGTCTETSQANCAAAGDVWTAGQTCGAGVCLTGACCIPATGDCTVTNEADCDAQCGVWWSGGSCSPNPCGGASMGACCYGSGLCVLDTEEPCACRGGTYSGDGTTCEPNPCPQPPVIYVDVYAPGTTQDGSSWATAYLDLQQALSAASGGGYQVWVSKGTYKPTSGTDRNATFQLLNNVALYGGFEGTDSASYPGGETLLSQRDPSANPTILSGQLTGGNKAYHVLKASHLSVVIDRTAVLDGFVIRDGAATGTDSATVGGAMYNSNNVDITADIPRGGVTIRNCRFTANSAVSVGGAVYFGSTPATFVNCVFDHNQCTGSGQGGAIRAYLVPGGALTLANCSFVANSAAGSVGGAMLNNTSASGSVVNITNCIFWGNLANGLPSQITQDSGSSTTVSYSDVQGGFTGTDNTNVYPQFLAASIGADGIWGTADDTYSDIRLASGSPCIDAGDNAADIDTTIPGIQPLPGLDGDLHARRMDDPDTNDSGSGSCPIVDMGVYEFRRICEAGECTRGDGNADGFVNGLDIQPLVDCLLGPMPGCGCPCYDMDLDGFLTLDLDVPCFVSVLLGASACVVDCQQTGFNGPQDCNQNGRSDTVEIAEGTSLDCNKNFVADECDIASETSTDWNGNGIPDECEPDCNGNGKPDDYDLAQQTSADIDGDGVPDECQADCNGNDVPDYWDVDPNDPDGNNSVSLDCSGNGRPDECELDCNHNDVPDDCDIDPNDPDGDEVVWPDCNGNHVPDACDLNYAPPRGSLDCNENGIPDECDIANCPSNDPTCQDCNGNGFPDGCDIAAEISLDENENGIPDECEEENRGGEGQLPGEGFGGGFGPPFGDAEAYRAARSEYYEWVMQQVWGSNSEFSGAEQFRRMVAKLQELGLPVRSLKHGGP